MAVTVPNNLSVIYYECVLLLFHLYRTHHLMNLEKKGVELFPSHCRTGRDVLCLTSNLKYSNIASYINNKLLPLCDVKN